MHAILIKQFDQLNKKNDIEMEDPYCIEKAISGPLFKIRKGEKIYKMKRKEMKEHSRKRREKNSKKKDPLPIRFFRKIGDILESILFSILKAILTVAIFIWDNKKVIAMIILLILLACYCFFTTKSLLKIENEFNKVNSEMNNITTELETEKEENQKLKEEIDSTKTDLEEKIEAVRVSKAEKKRQEEEAKRVAEEKARQEAIRLASAERSTRVTSRGGTTTRTSGSVSEYQAYAKQKCAEYGWSDSDFQNLVTLWNKESGWNPYAKNSSSGAYGIPQSLPASKMASYGSDYLTNYKTQINWGLNYIKQRYGNPTNAMAHSRRTGWY